MRTTLFSLGLVLLLAGVAAADITAVYDLKDGSTMTLMKNDDGRIRIDTGQDGYMLFVEEGFYVVTCEGGECMAMDMAQMAQMGQAMGGMQTEESGPQDFELVETGRTETIAGYKGRVYLVRYTQKGEPVEREVVFSTNPDVAAIQPIWNTMAKESMATFGAGNLEAFARIQEATSDKGGVLRQGEEMVLEELSTTDVPDERFKLPPVMDFSGFGN
jgi:hypothetical protein